MGKIITAIEWREVFEDEGFDNLLRSMEVGISVFRKDFVDDSPFAELKRIDQLDAVKYVLQLSKQLGEAATAMTVSMMEVEVEYECPGSEDGSLLSHGNLRKGDRCPVCGRKAVPAQ